MSKSNRTYLGDHVYVEWSMATPPELKLTLDEGYHPICLNEEVWENLQGFVGPYFGAPVQP